MKIVFLFSHTHVDYKRKNTRAIHIVIQKSQMERKNKKAERSYVKKNVHFSHLIKVHILEEDRRSEWMRHAIDRQHFKRRITCLAPIVERVLIEHRQKIRQR